MKRVSFFLFILISINSFAASECSGLIPKSLPLNRSVSSFNSEAVPDFSVGPNDLIKAPCKTLSAPELPLINTYFEELKARSSSLESFRVKGFKLISQPQEYKIALGELLPKFSSKSASVSSTCHDALCVVDRIWGEELGRKILYLKLKHGFNASEFAFSTTHRMTLQTLNQVLTTLSDLPSEFRYLGRKGNQQLTHSSRDRRPVASGGIPAADAAIKLYSPFLAIENDDFTAQYFILHELAHNISTAKDKIDASPEWKDLSALEGCAVSIYGKTNAVEDFAETIVKYRYNGEELKKHCPKKYEFLKKNVFSDRVFSESTVCD